uniref:Uncharacterized protein n=1 Tax=Haptolina ericina TaxID=156174 RepID=A0A7S3ES52_9EUKA
MSVKEMVLSKTEFSSGGARVAGDRAEMEILWKEFRKCFPSEALAEAAAERNSAVFNPQFNSPTKIKGTWAQLKKRFGPKKALEVIQMNPGVLICSPRSLEKESNESILKAAQFVEKLDANKGTIQFVSKTVGVLLIFFIGYGIAVKQGQIANGEVEGVVRTVELALSDPSAHTGGWS